MKKFHWYDHISVNLLWLAINIRNNAVGSLFLPYLVDRPESLHRFPNGINGESFFQKDVGGQVPPWVETITLGEEDGAPEEYLLWFHHVRWDHVMPSGRTLWDELASRYQRGVDAVRRMQVTWRSLGRTATAFSSSARVAGSWMPTLLPGKAGYVTSATVTTNMTPATAARSSAPAGSSSMSR